MIWRLETLRSSPASSADQPVPALHELHGCFALADAALAQDENALAVNLYKYAVPRDARRHLDAQVRNQRAHQTGCIFCGSQHGYFILGSELQHLVEHGKVARYDKRRRLCREQRVDMAAAFAFRKRGKITHFGVAEYLDAGGVKVFVIACQQQARAVHIRRIDRDIFQLRGSVDHFQAQLFHDLVQRNTELRHRNVLLYPIGFH